MQAPPWGWSNRFTGRLRFELFGRIAPENLNAEHARTRTRQNERPTFLHPQFRTADRTGPDYSRGAVAMRHVGRGDGGKAGRGRSKARVRPLADSARRRERAGTPHAGP